MRRTSVSILGKRFRIKKRKLNDLCGYCDPNRGEIVIAEDLKSEHDIQTTLIHEIVHAVLIRTGASQSIEDGVQEVICESISQSLYELGARIR